MQEALKALKHGELERLGDIWGRSAVKEEQAPDFLAHFSHEETRMFLLLAIEGLGASLAKNPSERLERLRPILRAVPHLVAKLPLDDASRGERLTSLIERLLVATHGGELSRNIRTAILTMYCSLPPDAAVFNHPCRCIAGIGFPTIIKSDAEMSPLDPEFRCLKAAVTRMPRASGRPVVGVLSKLFDALAECLELNNGSSRNALLAAGEILQLLPLLPLPIGELDGAIAPSVSHFASSLKQCTLEDSLVAFVSTVEKSTTWVSEVDLNASFSPGRSRGESVRRALTGVLGADQVETVAAGVAHLRKVAKKVSDLSGITDSKASDAPQAQACYSTALVHLLAAMASHPLDAVGRQSLSAVRNTISANPSSAEAIEMCELAGVLRTGSRDAKTEFLSLLHYVYVTLRQHPGDELPQVATLLLRGATTELWIAGLQCWRAAVEVGAENPLTQSIIDEAIQQAKDGKVDSAVLTETTKVFQCLNASNADLILYFRPQWVEVLGKPEFLRPAESALMHDARSLNSASDVLQLVVERGKERRLAAIHLLRVFWREGSIAETSIHSRTVMLLSGALADDQSDVAAEALGVLVSIPQSIVGADIPPLAERIQSEGTMTALVTKLVTIVEDYFAFVPAVCHIAPSLEKASNFGLLLDALVRSLTVYQHVVSPQLLKFALRPEWHHLLRYVVIPQEPALERLQSLSQDDDVQLWETILHKQSNPHLQLVETGSITVSTPGPKFSAGMWFSYSLRDHRKSKVKLLTVSSSRGLASFFLDDEAFIVEFNSIKQPINSKAITDCQDSGWATLVVTFQQDQTSFYMNGRHIGAIEMSVVPSTGDCAVACGLGSDPAYGCVFRLAAFRIWNDPLAANEVVSVTFAKQVLPNSVRLTETDIRLLRSGLTLEKTNVRPALRAAFNPRFSTAKELQNQVRSASFTGNATITGDRCQLIVEPDFRELIVCYGGLDVLLRWVATKPLAQALSAVKYSLRGRSSICWTQAFLHRLKIALAARTPEFTEDATLPLIEIAVACLGSCDPVLVNNVAFTLFFSDLEFWKAVPPKVTESAFVHATKVFHGTLAKKNALFLGKALFGERLLNSLFATVTTRQVTCAAFTMLRLFVCSAGQPVSLLMSIANTLAYSVPQKGEDDEMSIRLRVDLPIYDMVTKIVCTLAMLLEVATESAANFSSVFTVDWFLVMFSPGSPQMVVLLAFALCSRLVHSTHGSKLRSGLSEHCATVTASLARHSRQPLLLKQLLIATFGKDLRITGKIRPFGEQLEKAIHESATIETTFAPILMTVLVAHIRCLNDREPMQQEAEPNVFVQYRPLLSWRKILSVLRLRTAFSRPKTRDDTPTAVLCLRHLTKALRHSDQFVALTTSPLALQALNHLVVWAPAQSITLQAVASVDDGSEIRMEDPASPNSPSKDPSKRHKDPVNFDTAEPDPTTTNEEDDEGSWSDIDLDEVRTQLTVDLGAREDTEILDAVSMNSPALEELVYPIKDLLTELFCGGLHHKPRDAKSGTLSTVLFGMETVSGLDPVQTTKLHNMCYSACLLSLPELNELQIATNVIGFAAYLQRRYSAHLAQFESIAKIHIALYDRLAETPAASAMGLEAAKLLISRLLDTGKLQRDHELLLRLAELSLKGAAEGYGCCLLHLALRAGRDLRLSEPADEPPLASLFTIMRLIHQNIGSKKVHSWLMTSNLLRQADLYPTFVDALNREHIQFWTWAIKNATMLSITKGKAAGGLKQFHADQAEEIKGVQAAAKKIFTSPQLAGARETKHAMENALKAFFTENITCVAGLAPVAASNVAWIPLRPSIDPTAPTNFSYLDSLENVVPAHAAASNNEMDAACCDDMVYLLSSVVPRGLCPLPAFIGDKSFIATHRKLSDAALTLIRYILKPNETLKYITNAFAIRGLHIVPSLVLLSNAAVTLVSYVELLPDGNIVDSSVDHPASGGPDESSPAKGKEFDLFGGRFLVTKVTSMITKGKTTRRRAQAAHTKSLRKLHAADYDSNQQLQVCYQYPLVSIKEVRVASFQHHDSAVEIVMDVANGAFLAMLDDSLNFSTSAKSKFLDHLKEVGVRIDDSFEKKVDAERQLWQRHMISNFDYILLLNRVAGRTHHDYSQYPVVPWVLQDYTSSVLDLSNPNAFRLFDRPMSVQTDAGREKAQMKYEAALEMDRERGGGSVLSDVCHHSTHYSTAAGVLYYLVRLQPFTQAAAAIQGGKLDHADRMFHSIAASWVTASQMDGKELVPELYLCPQLLSNHSSVNLGQRQSGESIETVQLPPWAKNPAHFVNCLRLAFESEQVSRELHHWIDLVFGNRQRGEGAVESTNLYHPSTYRDVVMKALSKAETDQERGEIVARVEHFGQTPKQLFTTEHPPRETSPRQTPKEIFAAVFTQLMPVDLNVTRPVVGADEGAAVSLISVGVNEQVIAMPPNCLVVGKSREIALTWGSFEMMRRSVKDGSLLAEQLAFQPPCTGTITAVYFGLREAIGFVGASTGLIYVFRKQSTEGITLHAKTLQGHISPVRGLIRNGRFGRLISFTRTVGDTPIVWRFMRQRIAFLTRLPFAEAVVDVTSDDRSGLIAVASSSTIAVFDRNCIQVALAEGVEEISCIFPHTTREWNGGVSLLLTGHKDGSVSLWSWKLTTDCPMDGVTLAPLVHEGTIRARPGITVTTLYVSTDGFSVLAGFSDGKVLGLTVPTTELEKRGIHKNEKVGVN